MYAERTAAAAPYAKEDVTQARVRAIELYERVATSQDPRMTRLLRASARLNRGNVYFYEGSFSNALREWRLANSSEYGGPSLAAWSNVIAGLVLTSDYALAIAEGERAKVWAETVGKALVETADYSGIIGNMGFARLLSGDPTGALRDFVTAHAIRSDDALNKQNLAIGYLVNDRPREAESVLRKLTPRAHLADLDKIAAQPSTSRCSYLLWALATPYTEPKTIAANLLAYLGERDSHEVEEMTPNDLHSLRRRTMQYLSQANFPCRFLSKIPQIDVALSPHP